MLDNGTYLAPALNEKGDIWAHPPELLFQKIKTGLLDEDPPMPKCEGRMTDNEIKLVIQHIYSLWPEDIRSAYAERFKNSAIINEINNPM